MSDVPNEVQLAVANDGTGWHPAAWREPEARPADLLDPRYWTDLVVEAERGLLDLVTIDHELRADERTDRVRGRLELADLLQQWHGADLAGFLLRPATVPHDLLQITDGLVPELRRRRASRDAYDASTLRGTLGHVRPANRYTTVS